MRTAPAALGLALSLGAGCAAGPRAAAPDAKDKGTLPNGPKLNGTDLQGEVLQVAWLARGVTLAGGARILDARVEGGEIVAPGRGGDDLRGAELRGGTGAREVRLRIDSLDGRLDERGGGLRLYRLSYERQPGEGLRPLCPEGAPAIAVAGRWDYGHSRRGDGRKLGADAREVTFACLGSAIAKCAGLGYVPGRALRRPGGEAVDLAPLHEACVRAVRADYCGDGFSLTRAGEEINLYDRAGVQADTQDWILEAEWTADGARCVNDTRLVWLPGPGGAALRSVRDHLARSCPGRFQPGGACAADPAAPPALLITEHPPR